MNNWLANNRVVSYPSDPPSLAKLASEITKAVTHSGRPVNLILTRLSSPGELKGEPLAHPTLAPSSPPEVLRARSTLAGSLLARGKTGAQWRLSPPFLAPIQGEKALIERLSGAQAYLGGSHPSQQ